MNKNKDCPEGKEINAITGRCVKKCKDGEKRDLKTGKCMKIKLKIKDSFFDNIFLKLPANVCVSLYCHPLIYFIPFFAIVRISPTYGQRRVQQRTGLEYVGRQPRKRFGGGVRRHGQTAC